MMIQDVKDLPRSVLSYLQCSNLIGATGKAFKNLSARSSVGNLITIYNLFEEVQPNYTLEIGMAFGLSTLLFSDLHNKKLKNLHDDLKNPQVKDSKLHYAIDPFQSSVWDSTGLCTIKDYGFQNLLCFHESFSCFVLPQLLQEKKQYGMIYIDGSHLFEDVFIDFYYASLLLADNGILLFDDCSSIQVLKVVKFIKRNLSDYLEEIDLTKYRGYCSTVDKSKYQLGRFLGKVQARAFRKIKPLPRPHDAGFNTF